MAAPVRYDVGSDILYIGITPDYQKLWIVSNSNSAIGKSLFWWAYTEIPLSFDGQSHKVVLDSQSNPDFKSITAGLNIHFQDGILYYSAFKTTGKVFQKEGEKLIAFHLNPGSLDVPLNGDGIYVASDIVGDYNSYAHSAQNNLWNIVEGAASLAAMAFLGVASPLGSAAAGALMSSIAAAGNESKPITKEQMQEIGEKIAVEGWNAYSANIPSNTEGPIEENNQNNHNTNLSLAMGIIAVLLLFFLRR